MYSDVLHELYNVNMNIYIVVVKMLHPREDSEVIICLLTQEIRGQKRKQNKKISFFLWPTHAFQNTYIYFTKDIWGEVRIKLFNFE